MVLPTSSRRCEKELKRLIALIETIIFLDENVTILLKSHQSNSMDYRI